MLWTVMLEKTLESPLDCKEIKPVNPKGNQSWIFIGRTDAEAEALILWAPDAKNQLIGKDPEAGKEWGQEEKGTTEEEMIGWHDQLNGYELEQAPGVGDGQGSLVCCSPWGCKESDMTKRLNWIDWQILLSQCNICAYCSLPPTVIWDLQPIGLLINLSRTQQMRTKPCLSWLLVQISCSWRGQTAVWSKRYNWTGPSPAKVQVLAAEPSSLTQKSGSPAGWPPQSPWWHGCSSLQWAVAPFPPATPTGTAPFLSGTDGPAQILMLCLAYGSGTLPTVKAERQRGFFLRGWKTPECLSEDKFRTRIPSITPTFSSSLIIPPPLNIYTHTNKHTHSSLSLSHPTQVQRTFTRNFSYHQGLDLIFSCRLKILNPVPVSLQNLQMV